MPLRGVLVTLHRQRQALADQRFEDRARAVDRTMVDHGEAVEDPEVVANERLDDVGLVTHHGDAGETHANQRTASRAAFTASARYHTAAA